MRTARAVPTRPRPRMREGGGPQAAERGVAPAQQPVQRRRLLWRRRVWRSPTTPPLPCRGRPGRPPVMHHAMHSVMHHVMHHLLSRQASRARGGADLGGGHAHVVAGVPVPAAVRRQVRARKRGAAGPAVLIVAVVVVAVGEGGVKVVAAVVVAVVEMVVVVVVGDPPHEPCNQVPAEDVKDAEAYGLKLEEIYPVFKNVISVSSSSHHLHHNHHLHHSHHLHHNHHHRRRHRPHIAWFLAPKCCPYPTH